MTREQRTRRRWWWRISLVLVLLAPLAAVVSLPAWLNSASGRRWLLARANRTLAPGGLDVASFHFSWFGPTRMQGFSLINHERNRAHVVVDAPLVRWDRNLWQVLFDRPRFGTLVLERADLNIERKADGTVDLYQALEPILRKDPKLDLKVVVERGRLRFRSAGMPEPVLAEQASVTLHFAAAPHPLTWRLDLARSADPRRQGTLAIQGSYDRWDDQPGQPGSLTVTAKGSAWPWTIAVANLTARGRLHGDLSIDRRGGHWTSAGDARITDAEATGAPLAGDHLRVEQVKALWDMTEADGAWNVRRFDVTSPFGALRASGVPTGASRIEGTLDIAALAGQLPHTFRLRDQITLVKGSAQLAIASRIEARQQLWDVEARVSDLQARDHEREREITLKAPATLSARIARHGHSVSVERMALASAFLNVEGRGDVDQGLSVTGTLDLAALQHQLEELVDFGRVALAGQGRLTGRYQRTGESYYEGRSEIALSNLRIDGVGPAPLHRDAARLTLTLQGPATAEGLPAAWTSARSTLTSGSTAVELAATARGGATDWTATAQAPLVLGERAHHARASVSARADGTVVALPHVELALSPEQGEPIQLRARGSFDRTQGTLLLVPAQPAAEAPVLALAPDGIRIQGIGSSQAFHAEGSFVGDVARTIRLVAPEATGLAGTWSLRASASAKNEGLQIAAALEARDLSEAIGGPVSLSLDALASRGSDGVDVSELAFISPFANVELSGRVSDSDGQRSVALHGTVTPRWEAINRSVSRRIDPRGKIAGRPGRVALRANLSDLSAAAVRRSLEGEAGFELTSANFFGMRVGKTPIRLVASGGTLRVAPIDTTINDGRLHLEPVLAFAEKDGATLHLGPESSVQDAAINDEVSHRVLSYVAPVLDSATAVRGRVSVDLKAARFPLTGGRDRHTEVDGVVTFQDVEFVAGSLVDDLMGLIGREPKMSLKLNKPVSLLVAGGRVQTEGLALPLGNVTEIDFSGWVAFDRNMNFTASLPVTRKMVGNVDFLGDIVEGTRIRVPIRGTVDRPRVDREALQTGMRELSKTLLERTAGRGVAELLMRLARPRDPDAPPRQSPAEAPRTAQGASHAAAGPGPAGPVNPQEIAHRTEGAERADE